METVDNLIVTTSWDDGSMLDMKLTNLLEKYSIKGTFYITKSYVDNPLGRNELIMLDKVHELGAHTLNHVDLTKVSLLQAKGEIEGVKTYLEDIIGHETHMFCYPYGKHDENIKRIVRKSGFVAARTCTHGSFNLIRDPYEWQVTLHASNGSPLMTLKIWRESRISIRSLLDWEVRAKLLFDLALVKGGIYHLWGHSNELEEKEEWDKLDRVFSYISKRETVRYMTNGEIFKDIRFSS